MAPEMKALLTDLKAVLEKHNAYIEGDADAADDTNLSSWPAIAIQGEGFRDLHRFEDKWESTWTVRQIDEYLEDAE